MFESSKLESLRDVSVTRIADTLSADCFWIEISTGFLTDIKEIRKCRVVAPYKMDSSDGLQL